MFRYVLIILVLKIVKICDAKKTCYNIHEPSPFVNQFAAQTPYFQSDITHYDIKGCKPVKTWIVVRHGTCHPPDTITNSYVYLQKMQGEIRKTDQMCQKNFDLIKNWKENSSYIPHDLTWPQGWDDLKHLGNRWHLRYPNIFDSFYSPKTYKFGHTTTIRTKHSCQGFIQGLFGENVNLNKIKLKINDILMSPFMNCTEYMNNFSKVKNSKPIRTFESTDEFQQVLRSVRKRLGLSASNFQTKELLAIFNQCTYDQAANLQALSPWCSAFGNSSEMEVLTYFYDLENYYKASYGYKHMAQKLPCAIIMDMYQYLKDSTSSNKVTAYFTHSYMLEMMLTALGNFHDKLPLQGDNFLKQTHRKFKTNKFLKFASNLAAVKYECSANKPAKILFLWNERKLSMPWCKNGAVCTLDEIKNMYENSPMSKCPCDVCGNDFATNSLKGLPRSLFPNVTCEETFSSSSSNSDISSVDIDPSSNSYS